VPFLKLSFELGTRDARQAEQLCFAAGALAVTLADQHDSGVFEPLPGEVRLWPETRVEALFSAEAASPSLLLQLAATLQIDPGAMQAQSVADRAWEREWLRDFHAMRFGRRLWICPHHETVEEPGACVLRLDPGLAFGTGTHPSTALCLRWLDAQTPVERAIDFGCGSGVLGIAAALLGTPCVQAYDIDPQALTATRDNARQNAVDTQVQVVDDPSALRGPVDLVMANILAPTLIELRPVLLGLIAPHGRLLLAGILSSQREWVAEAFAPWCDIRLADHSGEWITLIGTRNTDVHHLS
jgi:ribosomal protein L11 methyltransferase